MAAAAGSAACPGWGRTLRTLSGSTGHIRHTATSPHSRQLPHLGIRRRVTSRTARMASTRSPALALIPATARKIRQSTGHSPSGIC